MNTVCRDILRALHKGKWYAMIIGRQYVERDYLAFDVVSDATFPYNCR